MELIILERCEFVEDLVEPVDVGLCELRVVLAGGESDFIYPRFGFRLKPALFSKCTNNLKNTTPKLCIILIWCKLAHYIFRYSDGVIPVLVLKNR